MASIAFFSDDETGTQCALLTALGLNEIDARAKVALPLGAMQPRADGRPDALAVVDLGRSANAYDVDRAALAATHADADLVASLPLSRIGDAAIRARFDAVITVGCGQPAAARALRAARYDTMADQTSRPAPPWFLARADQSLLMTKARLASGGGPRLPFGTRALPFAMPRLTVADLDGLSDWAVDDAILGAGVLLAALCLAIAVDPTAPRLDASDLATMMADGSPLPAGGNAARLAALARAYERVACEPRVQGMFRSDGRLRDRRPVAAGTSRPVRNVANGVDRRLRRA